MTMADKIVVLRAGVVEQVGRPLDLYDRPANKFVAGFIGSPSMNFIPAKISGGRVVAGGLDLAPSKGVEDGRNVSFGIRPEHIRIDANGHKAEVLLVEPTGAETVLQLRLAGAELTAVVRDRVTAQPGETIGISFDAITHLFDPETEARLGA
jgi:multiple sugar transport system ATP-binding protein